MRDSQYCFLNPHAYTRKYSRESRAKYAVGAEIAHVYRCLRVRTSFRPSSTYDASCEEDNKRGGMKDERGFKECRASWKFLERRAEYWAAYGPYRNYQSIRVDEDSRAETSGVLKRMNRFERGINGRWHVVADLFFNWFALFSFFFLWISRMMQYLNQNLFL